jgi:hypothetical protein
MKQQIVKKQAGLSFWGFVWSAVMVVLVSYILILSIPVYINNAKLDRALQSLAEEPAIMRMSRKLMIDSLERKLNIDMADRIINIHKVFKFKKVGGKRELMLDYEVVIPVVYNASLLFDFKNHVLAPVR